MFYFVCFAIVALIILGSMSYACYLIPKMLGFPKASKFTVWFVPILAISIVAFAIFEDDLFTKNDAKELLSEQSIFLNDDFELVKNESMMAPGEYYHTFTLKISKKDKLRLIKQIAGSKNFKQIGVTIEDFMTRTDRYKGPKLTQNYETESQFIREYFEPHKKGYAPTYRKIEIDKNEALLIFEDIDD